MPQHVLSTAIRHALRAWPLAGTSLACLVAIPAAAQNAAPADNDKSQKLETIVVTGSNIRRVDTETASPVLSIDRSAIQKSGKLTLGELVQDLPSIAGGGNAMDGPQVNNGGGTGQQPISLRGLGSARTLMLVNGHRVAFQDANQIPANAVERIDVLTDGASAVYGSDAIAGVVNFIMRSNYQGAEFSTEYGISDHDDGARRGYHLMFGQSTDKGNITAGLNYVKNDAVFAQNREYSKDALYLSYGVVAKGGSSRSATGRVDIPSGSIPGSLKPLGCKSFTLKSQAPGAGGSTSDYRCYIGTDAQGNLVDAYNFQAHGNYDLIPAERTGAFLLGNYKLTESVEAYVQLFHNKYHAGSSQAPVPFDTQTDANISSLNYYNPFAVDFTIGGGARYRERLESVGPRLTTNGITFDQLSTGFKGSFLDSWTWDLNFSYGKRSRLQERLNSVNYAALAGGFGPSYKDASGNIVCGTDPAKGGSGPIAGCTPINIFNQADPATAAALNSAKASYFFHFMQQYREGSIGTSGTIVDLPAGSLSLAAGVSYRKQYENDAVDAPAITQPPDYASCPAGSSLCAAPVQGGFNVKEAYVELLVPIVKDLPFAKVLNLDIGTRFSKYSNFGSTNNWKVALEYRPIDDLLLRATVSKVFRAPSITDIYAGPTTSNPPALDPCNGVTINSDPRIKGNPACRGVPLSADPFITTATSQTVAVATGASFINYPIKPEFGKSYDFGFVYDPQWLPGLSVSADVYRVTLNSLILSAGAGTAAYILQSCYQSYYQQGITQPFCSYINRTTAGDIFYILSPTINVGSLLAKGADASIRYRLPETSFGNFTFNLQASYINKYDITTFRTQHYAGHYDPTFGNYARLRALGGIDWNLGSFSANWQARYVGPITVGYQIPELGPTADNSGLYDQGAIPSFRRGAQVYHNVSFAYHIEPMNTTVRVGIDNVGDKKPPILYQENTGNQNTDVSTYDTVGRFFFGSVTVKF